MSRAASTLTGCGVAIESFPASAWYQVRSDWEELAGSSPYTSLVLTAEWIESWLETFGPLLQPEILIFRDDGEPVAACLLIHRVRSRGPFAVRCVYLNADGEDESDETCPEYNSILCRDGMESAVTAALADYLLSSDKWDEFSARNVSPGPVLDGLLKAFQGLESETTTDPTYFVDLERVRASGLNYIDSLGQPTRKHLRQNVRHYSTQGEITVQTAESTPQALEMLEALADLHQRSWTARGKPGVFSSNCFFAFHRAFVRRGFAQGKVELFRVLAAGATVGMLYTILNGGTVHHYQSAFNYSNDKRLSPGTVTLANVIQHCVSRPDLHCFDFMAGDSPYKRSLSTGSNQLVSVTFRRERLKHRLIALLRQAKRRLRDSSTAQ